LKKAKEKRKVEEEMATIVKVKEMLTAGQHVKDGTWTPHEIEHLNKQLFLTSKPVIYLVNIGD
jgi:obg-like ATPase 1